MPAIVLVSLLWRLPSFFDPPWVNDEGTYFAVAQAMAHGYRLYAQIWENKPPGLYLLYSAVYHWPGASVPALRTIASLCAMFLILATYRLAARFAGLWPARAAALLVGLALGVPFLEGTTLNAELPLALCTTGAVLAAFELEWYTVAGALMVAALSFKAVAGFDAVALGIWLLVHRRDRLPAYVLGGVAAAVPLVAAAWLTGILNGMVQDAFLYDLGYVGHGNGGAIPWLLGVKLLVLLVATVWLRRAPFVYLWALWAVAGALFSGRVFGHYTLQAVAPLSLAAAVLWRDRLGPRVVRALPLFFLSAALISSLAGWLLAGTGHDTILARRLQYYANAARYALHTEPYTAYEAQLDDRVRRNERVAHFLGQLPAGRLLVWGNTPWVYVLSGRLPATRYTSALRQPEVPGESAALRQAIRRGIPEITVVVSPPLPPLGSARPALRRSYLLRRTVDNASVYVRVSRP